MELLGEMPSAAPDRPTVLVVEDEVLIRLMIADELRSHGLSVIEAANADEALTVLESSIVVDLLFTDVRMPGSIDGIRLVQLAQMARPGIKVVITSGHGPALSSTVDAFFPKPYDMAAVVSGIKRLVPEAEP
jgi:DNA-binding NtrC family response regulator